MSLSVSLKFYYNSFMNSFPSVIPIFPLSGVIYFPKTNLPLNIFERRYLDLVNGTYNKDKLMGMVQSQKKANEVYKVGCLGKITSFRETEDRRDKREEREKQIQRGTEGERGQKSFSTSC